MISIVEKKPVDENTIENIRAVYNDFLSEFPLCFLYWKRFADHEYSANNHTGAISIYERAIESVAYSVDIWINYTTHLISKSYPIETIRNVFSKGASTIGSDFQSAKFWDKYIEFETSQDKINYSELGYIFNTILRTPIDNIQPFYEKFKDMLDRFSIEDLITTEEHQSFEGDKNDSFRKVLIENRDKWYNKTLEEINKRISYEWIVGKRFFFHIQPVDETILATWRVYLDYIETQSSSEPDNIIKLYERCLIPCCYYPEFWIKFTRFLESIDRFDQVSQVYQRATGIFLKKRPDVHLEYSMFLESQGKTQESLAVLENIHQQCPSHIETIIRIASFKKRHSDLNSVDEFYKSCLEKLSSKNNNNSNEIKISYPFLSTHYSRFLQRSMNLPKRARKVLDDAINRFPDSKYLYLAAIQFEMSTNDLKDGSDQIIIDLYEKALENISNNSNNSVDRQEIWNNYLEFSLDWSSDINVFRELSKRYKTEFPNGKPESKKRLYSDTLSGSTTSANNNGSVAAVSGNASPINVSGSGGSEQSNSKRVAYSNNNQNTPIQPNPQNPYYYQQQQPPQQQQQPFGQQPYQQQPPPQQQQYQQYQQYQGYNGYYQS